MTDAPREPPLGDDEPAEEGEQAESAASGETVPDSPYPLDDNIWWMQPDDVMAVQLGGPAVGTSTLAMDIAVPVLFKLHQLVAVLAAKITGHEAGTRGPAPEVPEAGLLSLVALQPGGSVVLRFGLAPGEMFHMTPEGETSPTQEVVRIIAGFIEASAQLDAETLFGLGHDLGPRVANNFYGLVQVLADSDVDTRWETDPIEIPLELSAVKLKQVEALLETRAEPVIELRRYRGWLFQADGKGHRFNFERDDHPGERLPGTFPPALREKVREAWDQLVEIEAIVTETWVRRSPEPTRIELDLRDVIAVLGEHQ
jgi:hypothetical protein